MTTFSVLLPIYKNDEFIIETFNSLLNQTFRDFEIIAVIDNLNTNIPDHIHNKFSKNPNYKKINFFEFSNMGLTKILNKGISLAKGRYIVRNDSDDLSASNRLEKINNLIEKEKNIKLIYSHFHIIDTNSIKIKTKKPSYKGLELRKKLNFKNPIGHSTVTFHREFINNLGKYNEELKVSQDYDLWSRVVNTDPDAVAFIKDTLVSIRYHKKSISESFSENQRQNSVLIAMNNKFYPKKFNNKNNLMSNMENNYYIALKFAYLYGIKKQIRLNIASIYYLILIYTHHKSLLIKRLLRIFKI
ncbi:MAG: hypothetical protein CMI90_00155 [Pelagibacteraceae bacterium]|nr:hypothetical protein [Pelagibacteraceae bacterium]|tara:strand:- start:1502 stop:2404 length:903 start_codon:yes stop_codon:yes gene_type:complete